MKSMTIELLVCLTLEGFAGYRARVRKGWSVLRPGAPAGRVRDSTRGLEPELNAGTRRCQFDSVDPAAVTAGKMTLSSTSKVDLRSPGWMFQPLKTQTMS